jgi:hypothetical protein
MDVTRYRRAATRYTSTGNFFIFLSSCLFLLLLGMVFFQNWPTLIDEEVFEREIKTKAPYFGMVVLLMAIGYTYRVFANTLADFIADVER